MFQLVDICANDSGQCIQKILLVGARIWAEGSACVATTFVFEQPQPKAKQTIKMSTIITLFPTLAKRKKGVNCKTSIQQNPLPTSEVETTLCYQITPFANNVLQRRSTKSGVSTRPPRPLAFVW
jgi:hypothetical protein